MRPTTPDPDKSVSHLHKSDKRDRGSVTNVYVVPCASAGARPAVSRKGVDCWCQVGRRTIPLDRAPPPRADGHDCLLLLPALAPAGAGEKRARPAGTAAQEAPG